MPLTIHDPESAPMSSRMTKAMLTDDIFSERDFSKDSKVRLLVNSPNVTHTAAANSSTICDAPPNAPSPKSVTTTEISTTSVTRGMQEIQREGSLFAILISSRKGAQETFASLRVYYLYYLDAMLRLKTSTERAGR